jgi:hypothetical protein
MVFAATGRVVGGLPLDRRRVRARRLVPEADGAHFCRNQGAAPHKGPRRWPEDPGALWQSMGIRMRIKARVVCLGRSSGPERGARFEPPTSGPWRPSNAMARMMACALVLWVGTCLGTPAAEADPAVRVFAIRGVAGMLFSRGMDALCDELAEFASVTCTVEDFTAVDAIESEARAASAAGAHVVLVGHSMGADAAIEIATEIAGPVAMVAAIDPPRFRARPVTDNVAVVLNYYQRVDFFGRGEVSTVAGFKGRVTRIERDEPHIMIDRDPEIHAAIIAEIVNLLQ